MIYQAIILMTWALAIATYILIFRTFVIAYGRLNKKDGLWNWYASTINNYTTTDWVYLMCNILCVACLAIHYDLIVLYNR